MEVEGKYFLKSSFIYIHIYLVPDLPSGVDLSPTPLYPIKKPCSVEDEFELAGKKTPVAPCLQAHVGRATSCLFSRYESTGRWRRVDGSREEDASWS